MPIRPAAALLVSRRAILTRSKQPLSDVACGSEALNRIGQRKPPAIIVLPNR